MRTILKDPILFSKARDLLASSGHPEVFSAWLGEQLESKIKSQDDWQDTDPIILGSWARNEICLKSDVDVLFCGDEAKTFALVTKLTEAGLKLRYRMPQNMDDWTVNVEAFDILALLKARALTSQGEVLLQEQQKKIRGQKAILGKSLLKAVRVERKDRAQRFDSITNFLEPNLKYGPGGLRDIEQGLQVYELFSEKIANSQHAIDVLKHHKKVLLSLRQKLHLEGIGDVLVNTTQFDLASWMGFSNQKDFMRELQAGFSRAHFYSAWLIEAASVSKAQFQKTEKMKFANSNDLSLQLQKNSSILVQKRVRESLSEFFPNALVKKTATLRGKILNTILSPKTDDRALVAHFNSRLIDKLLPEIKRLVGYVQHDQYHRFTADTHIMQACREFKRIYKAPKELGALKVFHKNLKAYDWKVLQWACLYHDLAKGLESQDHSGLGVEIVKRDFKSYGFTKKFTEDVSWLVENHLELSMASFRKNPKSLKVWEDLKSKKVEGMNLYRLAIFTVIDIRATNPEAWNDWKSRLMRDLVLNLESKSAQNYFNFSHELKRQKLQITDEIYNELDPLLLESVSAATLVEDLKKSVKNNLKPLVIKNKKSEIWIRFHSQKDQHGLLSSYVSQLYSLGLGIRHASISTIPQVGVYDWFQVVSSKKTQMLRKILENSQSPTKPLPSVKFTAIEVMSADDKEWVLSFKGVDQSGLLAAAAQSLADNGIDIKSAKVHTWGRQIEDIFIVKPHGDIETLLRALRTQFI